MLKNPPTGGRPGFDPWVGKTRWWRHDNPRQHSCLENPRGQRRPAGYSPWGGRKAGVSGRLSTPHSAASRKTVLTILFAEQQRRYRIKNGSLVTAVERGEMTKWHWSSGLTMCKTESQGELAGWCREPKAGALLIRSVLSDPLGPCGL